MKIERFIVIIIMVSCTVLGCSKENVSTTTAIVAEKLTDKEYKNGIYIKDNEYNQFFYKKSLSDTTELKPGTQLQFNKAGVVVVTKVMTEKTQEHLNSFIVVSKKLDPAGDGYPNKITIVNDKSTLIAENLTDLEYKNGIFTKNGLNNLVFCTQPLTDPLTLVTGKGLAFSKTGIASIISVAVAETKDTRRLFITVDKNLDPEGDGFPNPIKLETK